MEVYPSLAFDNLFENRGSLRNISILDRVKDQRRSARAGKISSTDKAKLDEYLTSVREVEKRVDGMRKSKDKAEDLAKQKNQPGLHDGAAGQRPAGRPARAHAADVRHHRDRLPDRQDARRLAAPLRAIFRRCTIRSWTCSEGAPRRSHNNNSDGYERIARFHVSQFAYLADQAGQHAGRRRHGARQLLPDVPLEHVVGRKHDNIRLPLVLAGGLGGTLETGRSLNYLDAGDDNRKMCSLYLSLMDRMGVKLDHFGDADTRLERL